MLGVTALAVSLVLSVTTWNTQILPEPLRGVKRIVCLGDSITQQGERPGGYVWLLRHTLSTLYPQSQIQVLNAGVSGNKSTDMLVRYQADVLDRQPDLILISVGVNDVWHGFYDGHSKGDGPLGIPVANYRENVEKLIARGKQAHSKVIIVLATQIGEDFQSAENQLAVAYNNTLRQLASESNCAVVDLQTPFRKLIAAYRESTGSTQNFLTVDGVHMNAQGNQVMAQTILSSLGVPDASRRKAQDEIENQMRAARPHPGPLPIGVVISDDMPARASSVFSEQFNASQANASGKGFDQRWCANSGEYTPNPWWLVDLGSSKKLTGIHIVFAPEDLDTWRYKVQLSGNGTEFRDVIDQSQSEKYLSEENHRFSDGTTARYVRILFTAPTSAQNWASLRHIQIYGK